MDITTLTWMNTLFIMAAVIILVFEVCKISQALRGVAEAVARTEETASRNARLTLAVRERLGPPRQA
jgi:predicted transcriptional regulator